jgi:digeranylgeranylglycerophospholipid reductase
MTHTHDVVIIGGGPAGLMAAKTAAEHGLKVVLLERKPDVSVVRRACCGHFIMDRDYAGENLRVGDGKVTFPRNGFEVTYPGRSYDIHAKYLISPSGNKVTFSEGDGAAIAVKYDKGVLLAHLLEECGKLGVDIRLGAVAYKAVDEQNRVVVQVTSGQKRFTVAAKKAILAGGVNAHITGGLGLNENRVHFVTAFVIKTILENVRGFERDTWNLHYGAAYHSNAPVIIGASLYGDDVWELTAMGNKENTPEMVYRGVTTSSPIAHKLKDAKIIDRHGCSVRAFAPINRPYRGNALAIGDAAAYVEVETQGALMCGHRAGNGVLQELQDRSGFEDYSTWWSRSFEFNGDRYLQVAQGYALTPTYTDDEIDYLFSLTEDEALPGSFSQYTTPELMWRSMMRHEERMRVEKPVLYKKIQKKNEMTLEGTF